MVLETVHEQARPANQSSQQEQHYISFFLTVFKNYIRDFLGPLFRSSPSFTAMGHGDLPLELLRFSEVPNVTSETRKTQENAGLAGCSGLLGI